MKKLSIFKLFFVTALASLSTSALSTTNIYKEEPGSCIVSIGLFGTYTLARSCTFTAPYNLSCNESIVEYYNCSSGGASDNITTPETLTDIWFVENGLDTPDYVCGTSVSAQIACWRIDVVYHDPPGLFQPDYSYIPESLTLTPDSDIDEDGIFNSNDNCHMTPNPYQGDADSDGMGDRCDDDADNDGTAIQYDVWPTNPTRTSGDTSLVRSHYGEEGDYNGLVVGMGDLNGDNYDDYVIGNFQYSSLNTVDVYNGSSGMLLYKLTGSDNSFGHSVDNGGDINKDGYNDIIVGSSGSVDIFSGFDGSLIHTFTSIDNNFTFGHSVSNAGDVNQDTYPDILVGDYIADSTATRAGSAHIFSGLDGSMLYTFDGDSEDDYFGIKVTGAGDVNNDNYADIAITAKVVYGPSYVKVFSGIDGSLLFTFQESLYEYDGPFINSAGDFNKDNYDDLLITRDDSSVAIYSGADGSVLKQFYSPKPSSNFGSSSKNAGDLNADGYDDFIIGESNSDSLRGDDVGLIYVLSGIDNSVIYTFEGFNGNRLGIVSTADINNDGYTDFLTGGYGSNLSGDYNAGAVHIFNGKALWLDSDGDGANNAVDSDDDNDGYDDLIDAFRLDPTEWLDSDNDGVGNNADPDNDNDGFLDLSDNCPNTPGSQKDTDSDGEGDLCDSDDDNDGVIDEHDVHPLDSTRQNEDTNFLHKTSSTDTFGQHLDGGNDVNGDGYDDYIVGNDEDSTIETRSGSFTVYSGIDNSILFAKYGSLADDNLGKSVSILRDLNDDGRAEFSASGGNYTTIYNGINGEALQSYIDTYDIRDAGDVNNDSYHDLLMKTYNTLTSEYEARVISGLDYSEIFSFEFTLSIGLNLSPVPGDVNNDGYDDIIIGQPRNETNGFFAGAVHIYSGQDGTLLFSHYGQERTYLGDPVSVAGDVNNDGYDDIIAGAAGHTADCDCTQAFVYSGKDGSILHHYSAGDWTRLGHDVSSIGDIDKDHYTDFAISSYLKTVNSLSNTGEVKIYSGKTGNLIYAFYGREEDQHFGFEIANGGDLNGDSYDDLLIGSYYSPSVTIINGKGLWLDSDGDTNNDAIDTDDDNDGILDIDDAYPLIHIDDPDNDTVFNPSDNCPLVPNTDQANIDGDSLGDACDLDNDNDSWPDEDELACGTDPLNSSSIPEDLDNDMICNILDDDDDGDGLIDTIDPEPLTPLNLQLNGIYRGTSISEKKL